MILLVDIGNSRIKSALWLDGRISEFSTSDHSVSLSEVWNSYANIERVIACNVAGPFVTDIVNDWCNKNGISIEWMTSTTDIAGLSHCYSRPESLGDDRWLGMAGARHSYNGQLCVVDCGTATTVDIVDAAGRHTGGAILPGVATMRSALNIRTHGLPVASSPPIAFADNTDQAIAGGTLYALVGAIDRLIHEAKLRYKEDFEVIIGGGEAEMVLPLLQQKCVLDTKLVLKGLAVAARLQ